MEKTHEPDAPYENGNPHMKGEVAAVDGPPGITPMGVWKALAVILAVLAGVGSITGVLGKAFFVTRDEYVTTDAIHEKNAAVASESLKRLEAQLAKQQDSLERLIEKIGEVQTSVAILAKRSPK